MPELHERFDSLSHASAPDLWPEIEVREPRNAIEPSSARRMLVAAVAFVVAIAGIGIAAVTFGGSVPPVRPSTAVANERIAFIGDGGDAQTDVYSMRPDGTDVRRLTRTSRSEDEPVWSPDATRIAFSIREEGNPAAHVIGLTDADGTNGGEVPGTRLQNHNPVGSPAWSPDGGEIAFAAYGDGGGIYVTRVAGGPAQQLTTAGPPTTRVDSEPVWSPDGTSMAFIRWILGDLETQSEYQILRIGTDGRHSTILARFPSDAPEGSRDLEVSGLSWSPDGSRLAFTSLGEVYVVDASGGDPEKIVPCAVLGCSEDTRVRTASTSWSPDGTRIAFTAWLDVSIDANEPPMIYVATVTATPAPVASTGVHGSSPSWASAETASDSQDPAKGNGPIYFRVGGADGGSQVESIEPEGSDRRVVFLEDSRVHYSRIAFSPDGTRIAFDNFLEGDYGIETADPDGSDIVRLTDGVNDSWASWSPDGTKILFSSTRYDPAIEGCLPGFPHEYRCPTDIYVMDVDGSNVVRLTDDPAGEFMPRWSPDGGLIAFVREGELRAGTYEAIYTMRPDGTNVRKISSGDRGSDFWPCWSPDGSQVVFAAIREEDWGLWVVNADGSSERSILGGTGAGYVDNPVWSPDGSLIAFVGNLAIDDYSPDDALYVMRPEGTGVTPIADAPGVGVAGDIAWQPIPIEQTSSPTPTQLISEPASVQVHITTTRGVAAFPSAVAVGGGGVWVTALDQDGSGAGEVIRLSPETGEVVARVPVRAAPGWEFGGAGITVANGSVWVVGEVGGGQTCCHAFVSRIDASTNEVTDQIELSGGQDFGNDVWVDGDAMYVLMFVDGASSLELAKVEIEGHSTAWRVPIPGQWSQTVFVAGGSAWVLGTHPDAHGPVEVDMLYRLDPGTGALIDQVPLPFASSAYIPSVAPETVWFRTNEGTQRFDALSGNLVGEPVRPGPGCCGGPFVSDGSGGVWVVSSAGADVDRSIWHIDGSGSIVASGTIPDRADFENMQGQSYAFDPLTQTIWVQHYEDSVSRVDIAVSPSDVPD